MPTHADERVYFRSSCPSSTPGRRGKRIRVPELGEDVARLDKLVEEVVVGGCIGEEGLARAEGEGDEVHEGGQQGGEVRKRLYVCDVGGEEADEGEEGAPELGPVVCCVSCTLVLHLQHEGKVVAYRV